MIYVILIMAAAAGAAVGIYMLLAIKDLEADVANVYAEVSWLRDALVPKRKYDEWLASSGYLTLADWQTVHDRVDRGGGRR